MVMAIRRRDCKYRAIRWRYSRNLAECGRGVAELKVLNNMYVCLFYVSHLLKLTPLTQPNSNLIVHTKQEDILLLATMY